MALPRQALRPGAATAPENAWIRGGCLTQGFLGFAARAPFQEPYNSMARHIIWTGCS